MGETRREFLKAGAKAVAGTTAADRLWAWAKPQRVLGANDRVRVAICGLHGRGETHIRAYGALKDTEIAALCDVDESVLGKRVAELEKFGIRPQTYTDIRKLLEDKSIDAVSIATPNHWHTLMAIWACQAGKDVYVEKPCSHNIVRRRTDCRGGAQVQPHGAARQPDPLIR